NLYGRPQFRPSGLSGAGYLRALPALAGYGRGYQPPAARRPHGFRALAGRDFGGTDPGRPPRPAGTLGVDAEYGKLVGGLGSGFPDLALRRAQDKVCERLEARPCASLPLEGRD